MNEDTREILTDISTLGKHFLSAEVLSIFNDKYTDSQLLQTIEKAKDDGILHLKNGVLCFQENDWKEFYKNAAPNESNHLKLAIKRDLIEGIKFHFENSNCSKRTFAAALIWQIRKEYYEWVPKDKLLRKIKAVDDILGFESWASWSLRIRLKAIGHEKIITQKLIEKWLQGKLHVDCMKFLRTLEIYLDKQHFSALLLEKMRRPLTEYQKMVLEFYQLDIKNVRNLSKSNLEQLEILNKRLKEASPQYVRLKVAILNLLARYFNTREPVMYKLYIEMALKLATKFNVKDWIAKLYNNLSLYYEEAFKAYSEKLKLRAIKEAREIGDYDTAAFIAINLAYSYLNCGEKILLDKLMEEVHDYIKTTSNAIIKSRFLEFKTLTAIYNGNADEFEQYLAEYKSIFKTTKDSQVLSKRYFANVLEILFHIFTGDLDKIHGILERLAEVEYIADDEQRFLKIVKTGLKDPAEAYMLFKDQRNKMRFFVEETLLFLSQILPKRFLEDFRKFALAQLSHSRKRGFLLSQAQLYHALGLAANKLGIELDAMRYIRFAAFLYDASGMDNLSHKLTNLFLHKEAFININIMKRVKENLEKAGINEELLYDLERSMFYANDSLKFMGRLMAVILAFSDAENFNELAEIIFKSLMEEFPASVGKLEFNNDMETYSFGTGEIPAFDTTYNMEPFYVSYRFYVRNNGTAKLELYNPEQCVDKATIQRFYDLMVYLEPIIEMSFLNFSRYKMAIRDELTGLYTRWYFEERFKEEFARSKRTGEMLSLIFCDLDDFKKINDNYGHKAGDEVLKNVARVFMRNTRETDIICRFGGEEFVFLLPDTTHNGAKVFAERLRAALENAKIGHSVTGSFGVATYPAPNISSREEILRIADDLCYKAKRDGKNLVRG